MDFQQVAEIEGITLCTGCDKPFDHRRGGVEPSIGVVHWSPRRLTRMGLRKFLMLVAAIRHSHNRGQPRWQVTYEQNAYAFHRGIEAYHRRFPKRWTLTDRAKVRYAMGQAGVLNDPGYASIARWAIGRED